MYWLHSQQSNFVFTVPILMEGTVYGFTFWNEKNIYNIQIFLDAPVYKEEPPCFSCQKSQNIQTPDNYPGYISVLH